MYVCTIGLGERPTDRARLLNVVVWVWLSLLGCCGLCSVEVVGLCPKPPLFRIATWIFGYNSSCATQPNATAQGSPEDFVRTACTAVEQQQEIPRLWRSKQTGSCVGRPGVHVGPEGRSLVKGIPDSRSTTCRGKHVEGLVTLKFLYTWECAHVKQPHIMAGITAVLTDYCCWCPLATGRREAARRGSTASTARDCCERRGK